MRAAHPAPQPHGPASLLPIAGASRPHRGVPRAARRCLARDARSALGRRMARLLALHLADRHGHRRVRVRRLRRRAQRDGEDRGERALAERDGAVLRGTRTAGGPTRASRCSKRSSTLPDAAEPTPASAADRRARCSSSITRRKSFGAVQALVDGFIELRRGEAHALVGENGAGKSTLVKILAGVHRPDSGRVLIEGEEVVFDTTAQSHAAGIAIIFQEPTLFPDLTVAENVFIGAPAAARRPPHRPAPHAPRRRGAVRRSSASSSTPTASRAASRSPTSRSSRSRRRSRPRRA